MQKSAKVVVAGYVKQLQLSHGVFYVHQITFDNGDSGEYLSKSMQQDKFIVGQNAHYEILPNPNGEGLPSKIKPHNPEFNNQGDGGFSKPANNDARNKSIERQVALKEAVTVVVATGEVSANAVLAVANTFYEWLQNKPQEQPQPQAPAPPQQGVLPPQPVQQQQPAQPDAFQQLSEPPF